MTNQVKNLTCDDDGRWSWTLIAADDDTEVDMCTNDRGEGISTLTPDNSWTVDSEGTRRSRYRWQQCTGTGQFSLAGCSTSAARGRILRHFHEA